MPPKGYKLSKEQRKRMSESAKKRKPLPKEVINRRNESIRKRYAEDPSIAEKISEKLKGENNPMYGQTHTEEARQKISAAQVNRVFTEEERKRISERMSGENHYLYGKHLSDEAKQKISKANTGKKRSPEVIKAISKNSSGKNNGMYGKNHSDETKQKISKANTGKLTGEKNPAWKGGISFEPYCPKWTEEFRNRIRAFFGYRCALCGLPQEWNNDAKLSCHHVEYNKMACCDGEPAHFAALCKKCHIRTNRDRDRWESMIHRIIDEIYDGRSYYTKEEYKCLKKKSK